MDGKTKAIVAHITIIGWIISFVLNSQNKEEFSTFYIRQTLGIYILAVVSSFLFWIPFIGWLLGLVVFVFWVLSLLGSLGDSMQPTPLIGEHFQKWFESI